ncbi:transglycosylase SLT domain-containing protein [Williamsia sp.]|uniref:transglycosylase SLT domain-containing protein n=1 Tax=Williamsia sp. TaxID=1872085 RepID=UPI002F948C86
MFVLSKLLHDARTGASRTHVRYVAGAATLAVAATITAGAISTVDPANAESPAAVSTPAVESTQAETTQSQAPAPAPTTPAEPAPAPVQMAAQEPVVAPAPPPAPVYADNLDGWIRQSLDILASKNIPASYDGIMRNIMRESTGNPQAINLYDSNAAAGIPSKGLLQVIDPTFAAYHVEGTAFDIWNPVSNIVAACNYAAHRYGSMDNVNSAY